MKVTLTPIEPYAEEHQPNPLTWYILKKTGKDTFVNVSAPIVCKDFFNDLAYTLMTGKSFGIYDFNAGKFKLPANEPVYMLLTKTTPQFLTNLTSVLNPELLASQMPMIGAMEVDNGILVSFDPKFFNNTYNISLVSLIIRLLNIEHSFKDFEEVKKYDGFPMKDQLKWNAVVAKNKWFSLPEKFKEYVWYCGPQHNSKTLTDEYQLSQLVHNNGVLSWGQYL